MKEEQLRLETMDRTLKGVRPKELAVKRRNIADSHIGRFIWDIEVLSNPEHAEKDLSAYISGQPSYYGKPYELTEAVLNSTTQFEHSTTTLTGGILITSHVWDRSLWATPVEDKLNDAIYEVRGKFARFYGDYCRITDDLNKETMKLLFNELCSVVGNYAGYNDLNMVPKLELESRWLAEKKTE